MHQPAHVFTIGPSSELVGGMSTVIGQMLQLNFAPRYTLSALPVTMSPTSSERGPRRAARHLGQRLLLGKMLRRGRAAIAHVHTCSGFSFHRSAWDAAVARRHGCRTVLHMHGARFDEYFAAAPRLEQRLVRAALQSADRVIALSRSWQEKLLGIAPDARVSVIENAVERRGATHQSERGTCRFLTLARMDAWKGIDDILDACAILKRHGISFELVLAGPAGTAGDAARIAAKIAQRNLETLVRYVGPALGEAKAKLFATSDVYVQPSHHEGLPISVLEAFASRLPVIATRVGAVPEVVEHEVQGLLTPPKNPAALAAAMSSLAIDPPRRIAMGNEGYQLAATRFSLSRFRDDLLELYDGLIRVQQHQARPLVASKLRTRLTIAWRSIGLDR
jgi:glycosyltransferase involved in cell wall biosynthesis